MSTPGSRSDTYVIEIRGETAGIVAHDGQSFRFYASNNRFNLLEGQSFATPREAERAALNVSRGRPVPPVAVPELRLSA